MAEIANLLRLVVYPVIYKVLYIPGGERLGFQPSTVGWWNFNPYTWEPFVVGFHLTKKVDSFQASLASLYFRIWVVMILPKAHLDLDNSFVLCRKRPSQSL